MGPDYGEVFADVAVKVLIDQQKSEIESSKGTGSSEQYYKF